MKQINKMGPPLLNGFRVPPRLASNAILDLIDKSAAVLDVRDQDTVASGYIRGSIHIAAGKSFIKWAGWLLPYDKPIYLMATDEGQAMEVARDMAMIGLDDVAGWFGEDALAAWETRRGRLDVFDQLSSREAYQRTESGSAAILDVRGLGEWIEGHVPGSKHIPLGYLQDRVDELQKDKQYLVLCYSGSRSAIAMTILKKHGFKNVAMVSEGFSEYEQTGLPIETGERVAMRA